MGKHKNETPKHVLDSYYSCLYIEKCKKCGIDHSVYSQEDDCSEFITSVGVLCKCGNIVWFSLPVH